MVLFKHFPNRQHDFSGNKETYLKQDTFTSQKSKNIFWIDKKKKKVNLFIILFWRQYRRNILKALPDSNQKKKIVKRQKQILPLNKAETNKWINDLFLFQAIKV